MIERHPLYLYTRPSYQLPTEQEGANNHKKNALKHTKYTQKTQNH